MNNSTLTVIKKQEEAVFKFRELFEKYGYLPYKMTKFEEYDLYAKNKDFLLSSGVITFTDTNGKLMALKPDVTLSIVKNFNGQGRNKLYYNENVYRVSESTGAFKEIMQVGLECLGDVDEYTFLETLCLADQSLKVLSNDYVLSVSDVDVVKGVLDKTGLLGDDKKKILNAISKRNLDEIKLILSKNNVTGQVAEAVESFVKVYGPFESVKDKLSIFKVDDFTEDKANELVNILEEKSKAIGTEKTIIDFSVTGNIKYYNGIVFTGEISGIANSVLSGGSYDTLINRMGKPYKAIGFAIYLDRLSALLGEEKSTDVDVVVLYDKTVPTSKVMQTVNELLNDGLTVSATVAVPEKLRYGKLIKL